jgi:hypothetical protein
MASLITASTTSSTALNFTSDTSGVLAIQTGSTPTTAVTIDGSQNVGIGTASPAAKLHTVGSVSNIGATFDKGATNQYGINYKNSAQTYTQYVDINNNGTNWWTTYDATNASLVDVYVPGASAYRAFYTVGSERMRIDSSGNVGIGVTPSAWASGSTAIQNAGKGVIWQFGGSNMYVGQNYYYDGSNRIYISTNAATEYQQGAGVHRWYIMPSGTAGTAVTTFIQAMTLDNSGNLLVGTNDSSGTSGIGVKTIPSATAPNLKIVGSSSTSADSGLYMYSTGASAFRFYVDYGGTIHATSTSISAISDQSLKTNVKDLETGLTEVMALKPRRFDWINGDAKNVAGFIAQEVEAILPELVSDSLYSETETKKNLKMGDMLPTLVKAIQEQQALITTLQTQVTALQAKVGV